MPIFTNFNKKLTKEEQATINYTQNAIIDWNRNNKQSYPEPINGSYIVKISKLEIAIGTNKQKANVPCFFLTVTLIDGADQKTKAFVKSWPGKNNPVIPTKLPLAGTKNDAKCIGSAIGLLSRLDEDTEIQFNGNFDQLAEDVNALRKKIGNSYTYLIEYDKEDFHHIRILEILGNNVDEFQQGAVQGQHVIPVPNTATQLNSNSYMPTGKNFTAQEIQKPTSYPISAYNQDELEEDEIPFVLATDYADELPF